MLLNDLVAKPLVGPTFNVYKYNNNLYKVVHFPRPRPLLACPEVDRSKKGRDRKLDAAVSRARKNVLELGLCNPWDWFGTFTLDKEKYNRYDLEKFHKDFTQWIRDQRKKTGAPIRYLLVPELHQDGAWHMHGLMFGVPSLVSFGDLRASGWKIPGKLVDGHFFCWMDFHEKFGFCSLGAVRNPIGASYYTAKYVTKSLDDSGVDVGKHLYYCSRGLDRSVLHSQCFEPSAELAALCTQKYEFCSTGFVNVDDPDKWLDALEFVDGLRTVGKTFSLSDETLEETLNASCAPFFEMQEGIQEALEGF